MLSPSSPPLAWPPAEGLPTRAAVSAFDKSLLVDQKMWPGSAVFHCARQIVGYAGFNDSDLDDLRQELAIHVLVQWPKFDPRRATARTFLDRILRQRQREILRQRRSKSRHFAAVSLSEDIANDRRRQPRRGHVADFEYRNDVSQIVANMSHEERRVALGLMRHTVTKLARIQRRHRQRLYESIRHIRKRFEDADLREYLS